MEKFLAKKIKSTSISLKVLDNKSCHDKKAANFDLKNKRLILVKREKPPLLYTAPPYLDLWSGFWLLLKF